MARVEYFEEANASSQEIELAARFRAGRRGELINIYRLLLKSPSLAETWFAHVSAVRWKTHLSGRLRELIIIRVAHLNQCQYALRQHVPQMAMKDGVTSEECEALSEGPLPENLSASEQAPLHYADAMTRCGQVSAAEFDALRPHFDEREIVELTVLIGTYIMHNRVIDALGIDLEVS